MNWLVDPMESTSRVSKCGILDWICTDLCLINCDLCGIYIYEYDDDNNQRF